MAYPYNAHYVPQMVGHPAYGGVPVYYPPNATHPHAYAPAPYAAQVPVNYWGAGVPQWGPPGAHGLAHPPRPGVGAFPHARAAARARPPPVSLDLTGVDTDDDDDEKEVPDDPFPAYQPKNLPYAARLSTEVFEMFKRVRPLFADSGLQEVECADPDVELQRRAVERFWALPPAQRARRAPIVKRARARHGRIRALDGQAGVYAAARMPARTVLGRYEGVELTKAEFEAYVTDEEERLHHQSYTFGAGFDKQLGREAGVADRLMIDPLLLPRAEQARHILMYVNDGRADISRPDPTADDLRFINVEAIEVQLEGWPAVFFLTTREVHQGEELALDYGRAYSKIVQEQRDAMDVDE